MMEYRWLLLVVLVSLSVSAQRCEHDCGPLGECVVNDERTTCADGHCDNNDADDYVCKCQPGYSGRDCSFRAPNVCRITGLNATLCLNGGICEEYIIAGDEANPVGLRCNCQAAYGQSEVHAGPQCEHETTDVCEAGRASSQYAFCTNEGVCNEYVLPGTEHPGCSCEGTGFEGRHCQFPAGTAPNEEIVYIDRGGYTHPEGGLDDVQSTLVRRSLSGFQVFLVVAIVGSVVAIGAFVGSLVWTSNKSTKEESGIEMEAKHRDNSSTDVL